MEKPKYAFVGCSMGNAIDPSYNESAHKLGAVLSQNGYNLVFGACNYGLMGEVYRTMKSNNSSVIGVAPTLYKDDFKTLQCDEEYCVDSINERISLMFDKSDIMVFLAGGLGTLEELIIALAMKKREEIDKPVIIFDDKGFYLPLLQQLHNMEIGRFSNNCTSLFSYIPDVNSLNDYLGDLNTKADSLKK